MNSKGIYCGCLGALVVGIGVLSVAEHADRDTYEATITKLERVQHDGDSKYIVFTKLANGETRVFENTDSLLEGKFNSSDVYGNLEEGKTYEFETYGWRIPFLSAYENIVSAELISDNNTRE